MGLKSLRQSISAKRLNLYAAHILVFCLPFFQGFVPVVLTFFLISNLFCHSWSERLYFFKKRKFFILVFASLYLLNYVGLLYTENMEAGLFQLEVQFSILIVPLVVLTSNVVNKYTLPDILKTYVIGTALAFIFCILYAVLGFASDGNHLNFFYANLSYFMHVGYFSMYINLSISILILLIFHGRNKVLWMHYILLSFFIVSIYLLSSRTAMIVTTILVSYGILYLVFPKLKWKASFFGLVSSTFLAAFIIYGTINLVSVNRVGNLSQETQNENSSFGSRLAMWKYSIQEIKESPWIGYGTGDAKDVVQERFRSENLEYAVVHNLNVHNEFMQVMLNFGIFGLLALIVPMLWPMYFVQKKGNFLYVLFIGNVALNFMTESALETQAGVVWYAVMWSFIYFTWGD